jgi:hypothetical protein
LVSVATIVKFAVAAVAGVPLIKPVDAVKVSPVGSAPALRDHVYWPLPPVAARVTEYGTATSPFGKGDEVVIAIAGSIVRENPFVAVAWLLSVTWIRRLSTTAVVGVPPIIPVEAVNEIPGGSDPVLTDHLYWPLPPVAVNVCEYGRPSVPAGNCGAVAIVNAGSIVIVNALLAVAWLVSIAVMVKLGVPDTVGVPLSWPLAALNVRPAGRPPEETDQLYWPLPPVAAKVWA